jgi:hypothetical protein
VRPGRAAAVAAALLLLLLGGLPAFAGGSTVHLRPERPRPGDVVLVHVAGAPPDLEGEWQGRPLRFFPVRDGMAALVGVDLDVEPGRIPWRLTRPGGSTERRVLARGVAALRPRTFETQRLTLPPHQVDLDPATLTRVRAEQAELTAALAGGAAERLWRGGFVVPVEGGQPAGGFGLRRVINGQRRAPHAGYDWAAPPGTPVLAANAGRVALVADHFFAGRLVLLDHGLGLFTHYYHLDAVRVSAGEAVARGQPIGSVGATGRVTGPHLHFGVSLEGARVDPLTLLGLTLPPDPA